MAWRPTFAFFFGRVARALGSRFALFIYGGLGLAVVGWALLIGTFYLMLGGGGVDQPIPADRAHRELAELLNNGYRFRLDPDAQIIAAHDKHGGMQGDGTKWFLVQLSRGRGPSFEAELLAAIRASGWAEPPTTLVADSLPSVVAEPLGWRGTPPAGVRAWKLENRTETYAIIDGDRFYFHWNHF